jgi:voltage-gated potassium channel
MIIKYKVHQFLNEPRVVKIIYGLIILNVIALILESYRAIRGFYSPVLNAFEVVSVIIFSIEYILRIWTIDLDNKYNGSPMTQRLKFSLSWLGLIDLFAVLPFYLPMVFPFDLRFIRILRLLRLMRIFKLARFSKSFQIIKEVLKETKSELFVTIFICFILLVFSSTFMYYIETDAQPDKFRSVGDSFWWAVATLTTVGYGDIYPITALGKFLAATIALIGIGFVALPTGIISPAFIEKMQKKEKVPQTCTCPNCGNDFAI